jgi:hypothetical protein
VTSLPLCQEEKHREKLAWVALVANIMSNLDVAFNCFLAHAGF